MFVVNPSPKMNYFDAKNFCKSLDIRSHLVEIRSQEIQNFVENLDLSSNGQWWIGALDQQEVKLLTNYYRVFNIVTPESQNSKLKSKKWSLRGKSFLFFKSET